MSVPLELARCVVVIGALSVPQLQPPLSALQLPYACRVAYRAQQSTAVRCGASSCMTIAPANALFDPYWAEGFAHARVVVPAPWGQGLAVPEEGQGH